MRTNYAAIKAVGIIVFLLFGHLALAQINLTVDASQNYTNFRFVDGNGAVDDNYVGKFAGAYDLGIQAVLYKGLYFRATIGMMNAGATYDYNQSSNEWDLKYARIQMGLGYMHHFEQIGVYLSASPYYGSLTRANQLLDNRNYNLIDEGFSSNDFGVAAMGGLLIPLTETLSANAGINYSQGFTNLEPTKRTLEPDKVAQKTTNYSYGLSLGAVFSIK